ncbi:hypothetical protein BO78DRAFT_218277 [Aspergillus sclerotiicarbonarius CBS 121057]|uniref:Uncharacterized protein n=1 Tax=Aspergillus sclerotiicarbonarius (strain CBS 121057 / IBT 28362) TaxID=1448318 RepID=A0A319EZ07_ASPSB|nr:hypothetical protein BO78DRAFT_218277 [Aspergillus sclerotiicarbonarius CBS 121057]
MAISTKEQSLPCREKGSLKKSIAREPLTKQKPTAPNPPRHHLSHALHDKPIHSRSRFRDNENCQPLTDQDSRSHSPLQILQIIRSWRLRELSPTSQTGEHHAKCLLSLRWPEQRWRNLADVVLVHGAVYNRLLPRPNPYDWSMYDQPSPQFQ